MSTYVYRGLLKGASDAKELVAQFLGSIESRHLPARLKATGLRVVRRASAPGVEYESSMPTRIRVTPQGGETILVEIGETLTYQEIIAAAARINKSKA